MDSHLIPTASRAQFRDPKWLFIPNNINSLDMKEKRMAVALSQASAATTDKLCRFVPSL